MERYIGCIFCGIARSAAQHSHCMEDVKLLWKEGLIEGFEEQSHLWTEMVKAPASFYGKGLVDSGDKSVE